MSKTQQLSCSLLNKLKVDLHSIRNAHFHTFFRYVKRIGGQYRGTLQFFGGTGTFVLFYFLVGILRT